MIDIIKGQYYILYNNTKDHVILQTLNQWDRMTDTCVGKLGQHFSYNFLSAVRRQDAIWTKAGLLVVEPLGANSSEIEIKM